MTTFNLDLLLRNNIRQLQPYASARSEYSGDAQIFLDANEAPESSALNGYNRYPDPLQKSLKTAISLLKDIDPSRIFLGNGSDEAIDLLIRATCIPGKDNILVLPPTYGMYEVSAAINDVTVRKANLTAAFQPDLTAILNSIDAATKIIFFCSPNNPTGNLLSGDVIEETLKNFNGLVVVDEAYVDFSGSTSWLTRLPDFENLVVLQTFSKAWGLAGLRIGMAFSSPQLISILNNVKPPYNISQATQELALEALQNPERVRSQVALLISERTRLQEALQALPQVKTVHASDANFLLVETEDASSLYRYLLGKGIVVRNRHGQSGCDNCLRITVGTAEENNLLIKTIKDYQK